MCSPHCHSETTLHGHTMAVTSVDWREETGDRSVLATCSDDRVSITFPCVLVQC